jgi:hypothetical protein
MNHVNQPTELKDGKKAAPASYREIAQLAYAIWQQRGDGDRLREDDWFEAEYRLLSRRPSALAAV